MVTLRRRVETPALVGRTYAQAVHETDRRFLRLDAVDGEGVPPAAEAQLVVVRQRPAPGTPLKRHQNVSVWLDDGGAGVRQRRPPLPPDRHLRSQADPDG